MSLFSSRKQDVGELIRRGSYTQAAAILRAEIGAGGSPHLRLQLSEVLFKAGLTSEASGLMCAVAEDFVRCGEVAKAIALLKRLQRMQPGEEVAGRIAHLIKESESERRMLEATRELDRAGESFVELDLHLDEALELREELAAGETATEADLAFDLTPDDLVLAAEAAAPSGFFDLFPEEDLLALIDGLVLQTYEPGDVVVTEGAAGESLFAITFGKVKAFVRDAGGNSRLVREMEAGEFFGEVALLRSGARTATVTAAGRVELLELDAATLESIAGRHPRVMDLARRFCEERCGSATESAARRSREVATTT